MTLQQLRQYDGTGEHNRVCVGVNGKIFDVTRGKKFYGPGESCVGCSDDDNSIGLLSPQTPCFLHIEHIYK